MQKPCSKSSEVVVVGSLVTDRKFSAAGGYRCGPEDGTVWSVRRHPGGVGRNVAVNLARLGARAAFVGLSGFGADAGDLEEELRGLGVLLQVRRIPGGVGRFSVFLDGRGRHMVSRIRLPDPAEGNVLCGAELAGRIAGAGAVVVEGGLDERLLTWVSRVAREHTTPLCALPTRIADFGPRAHLLPLFDVLVLNTAEAAALLEGAGGAPGAVDGAAEDDARLGHAGAQARSLVRRGPRVAVVTCGAAGAAVASAERSAPVLMPARPGHCLDDTGAGDALASAFVLGLVRGSGSTAALADGLRAAQLTVGCRQSTCRALRTLGAA
ncbi:ribokinase [Streptomyces sulfonofaciens]|uniref:Ribokinase n=1 Tax=Streptomyces sulfonofaciens TaxID=68272 RepID=A0A919KYK8_9ACTN|nr:PfkB family carbohydrate kinase [Streptomyces sulfonofaciens]GHH76914.1 ribokinase [Streptomyces sulfonofaciens]